MNGMDEWQRKTDAAMAGPPHPDSPAALRNRIDALEAALRRIRDDGRNCIDYCRRQAGRALARAALDKDTGK